MAVAPAATTLSRTRSMPSSWTSAGVSTTPSWRFLTSPPLGAMNGVRPESVGRGKAVKAKQRSDRTELREHYQPKGLEERDGTHRRAEHNAGRGAVSGVTGVRDGCCESDSERVRGGGTGVPWCAGAGADVAAAVLRESGGDAANGASGRRGWHSAGVSRSTASDVPVGVRQAGVLAPHIRGARAGDGLPTGCGAELA